jgi:hypothetical protein
MGLAEAGPSSRPRVPASEGRKTGPSVPIRKEKIVRHETKNLQIIVAEGFFEPNRINLQQKDDYPRPRHAYAFRRVVRAVIEDNP